MEGAERRNTSQLERGQGAAEARDAGELFVTDPSCLAMLSRMDFDPKYRGHDAPSGQRQLLLARIASGTSASSDGSRFLLTSPHRQPPRGGGSRREEGESTG